MLSISSAGVLDALPGVSRGRVGVYVLDQRGAIARHVGFDDCVDPALLAEDAEGAVAPDRAVIERTLGFGGERLIVTFDRTEADGFGQFFDSLFLTLTEKDQLELDMESMYSSSLALLEEVSMVGHLMSRLSTGLTEQDVVTTALEALMVAASVQRVAYVRWAQEQNVAQVLVHLVAEESTGRPTSVRGLDETPFPVGDGVLWHAIHDDGGGAITPVPVGGRLGTPGSPEHLAAREVLAVPVRCGEDGSRTTLGVILVLDKRANSFSNVLTLGSQESKMAANIASMIGSTLGNRLIAEYGRELKLANDIQRQILPRRPAEVPGFDLAGRCEISGSVGGDYFDFLPLADGRTLVVVADVSGHNLASGMIMVSARSTLKLLATKHGTPATIFDDLHANLLDDLGRTERFITAVGAALRPGDGRIAVVNAGHNDTMIYRAATRSVERVPSRDTILGFLPEVSHETIEVDLCAGDVVLLYTDGVTETSSASGEMFGEARLARLLERESARSAAAILDAVFAAVATFSSSPDHEDDVTVVVIKRGPDAGGGGR